MKLLPIVALSLALTTLASAITSDEDLPLDIQVRSKIDRPFKGWGKEEAKDHGKIYLLASVSEEVLARELVMTLDESLLIKHLRAELAKRGYR